MLKQTTDKNLIKIAFLRSKEVEIRDNASAKIKDYDKILKSIIVDKYGENFVKGCGSIANKTTSELIVDIYKQNRPKLEEKKICKALGIPELTVSNGFKTIQEVYCYKFGKLTKKGF